MKGGQSTHAVRASARCSTHKSSQIADAARRTSGTAKRGHSSMDPAHKSQKAGAAQKSGDRKEKEHCEKERRQPKQPAVEQEGGGQEG